MVMAAKLKLNSKEPPPQTLSQTTFPRGVITLLDQSKVPKQALVQADNIMLYEDGAPGPRWGTGWYGTALPNAAAIDGAFMYVDSALLSHVVAIGGGNIYRSLDDAVTWTQVTGATITTGAKFRAAQANGFLYLSNGVDSIVRYDGSTTAQVYNSLATPTISTPVKTGLAGTQNYTYYYRVAAVNAVGITASTTSAAGTITTDRPRSSFDKTANFITISGTVPTGTKAVFIYVGDSLGNESYLDAISVPSTTFTYVDNSNIPLASPNVLAPNANTTTGPVLSVLKYVGDRLWGTGDKNNPYRVWWTGSGPFIGYFANADYDGGYIDLNLGSQFRPVDVEDYRDGKGTPYATVWCSSSDGIGCVWQIQLNTVTVQQIYSYTQPSAFKVPGSRGTPAPMSVVNVLNDFMYYNSQAIYNMGSRAQFLNLLSTDEVSVNVRPTIRQVNPAAASKVCAYYFLDKVFFSVPYGTNSTNSAIVVYDTERKCWLPNCFTYGVEQFFEYADNKGPANGQGTLHLLAWKPGDNRLSEINSSIKGDYGQPFVTNLLTGLIPVSQNRFEFMYLSETDMEFSQPTGDVNWALNGIDRNKGYRTIYNGTISNEATTLGAGWSTFLWTSQMWDYWPTGTVPTYSESSSKKYFFSPIELNAYQFAINTATIDASYVLRTLQVTGTITSTAPPQSWRIQANTNN